MPASSISFLSSPILSSSIRLYNTKGIINPLIEYPINICRKKAFSLLNISLNIPGWETKAIIPPQLKIVKATSNNNSFFSFIVLQSEVDCSGSLIFSSWALVLKSENCANSVNKSNTSKIAMRIPRSTNSWQFHIIAAETVTPNNSVAGINSLKRNCRGLSGSGCSGNEMITKIAITLKARIIKIEFTIVLKTYK